VGLLLIIAHVEAVQEFQVISNNASAEFGRNAGAAVSIITKGGTNELRGTGFEFHRNENLRAKGVFEARKPAFERNDFGLSIGGPIRRDRTSSLPREGVRETSGTGAVYTVGNPATPRLGVRETVPTRSLRSCIASYPLPQTTTTAA
jgi:hypothetical protein